VHTHACRHVPTLYWTLRPLSSFCRWMTASSVSSSPCRGTHARVHIQMKHVGGARTTSGRDGRHLLTSGGSSTLGVTGRAAGFSFLTSTRKAFWFSPSLSSIRACGATTGNTHMQYGRDNARWTFFFLLYPVRIQHFHCCARRWTDHILKESSPPWLGAWGRESRLYLQQTFWLTTSLKLPWT